MGDQSNADANFAAAWFDFLARSASTSFASSAATATLNFNQYGSASHINRAQTYYYNYAASHPGQRFGLTLSNQPRLGRHINSIGHMYSAAATAFVSNRDAAVTLGNINELLEDKFLYQGGFGPGYDDLHGANDAQRTWHNSIEFTSDQLNNYVGALVGDWARRNNIPSGHLPALVREVWERGYGYVIRDGTDPTSGITIATDIISGLPQDTLTVGAVLSDSFLSQVYAEGGWSLWASNYGPQFSWKLDQLIRSGWGSRAAGLFGSAAIEGGAGNDDLSANTSALKKLIHEGKLALYKEIAATTTDLGQLANKSVIQQKILKLKISGQLSEKPVQVTTKILNGKVVVEVDGVGLVVKISSNKGYEFTEGALTFEKLVDVGATTGIQPVSELASNFGSTLGRQLAGDDLVLGTLSNHRCRRRFRNRIHFLFVGHPTIA